MHKVVNGILWGMGIGILILVLVGFCFGGATKQFKFLEYGTYTVSEEFPDKFFTFEGRVLYMGGLANGKGFIVFVEHLLQSEKDTILFVNVVAYGDKKCKLALLSVMTTTAVLGVDPEKWVVYEYYDKELYETGVPSRVLIPLTFKLDIKKFMTERTQALSVQEI